jgi:hypothetical protein
MFLAARFCPLMGLIRQCVLPGLFIHQDMAGRTTSTNLI